MRGGIGGGGPLAVEGLGEGKREAKSWWCGCGWKCAVGSGSFCVSRNTKRVENVVLHVGSKCLAD